MTAAMSEADLQDAVVDLAHMCQWLVMHTRPARTASGWTTPLQGDPGFPDLVLVHHHRGVLFRELKSATGQLTFDQKCWLEDLRSAGANARVWTPDDWTDGTIEQTLTGGG